MTEVRDFYGHLVCIVDESSGYIEAVYKKQTVSTYLPVGRSIRIERQGAVTIITRDTEATFMVERRTAVCVIGVALLLSKLSRSLRAALALFGLMFLLIVLPGLRSRA